MEPRVFYGFKLTAPLNNRSSGFWLNEYGAVRFRWHSYGVVRCGFKKSGILRCSAVRFADIGSPTVRFGAVFRCREPYGPVRYILQSGSVRFSDIVQ